MSVEQARLLIERMKTDELFRAGILAVEEVAEKIDFANSKGYDCTVDEISKLAQQLDTRNSSGKQMGQRQYYCQVAACTCRHYNDGCTHNRNY